MNPAHHLARQHVPRRDHQLKGRERDADRVGQMSPAARTKALREAMFEIVEFNLDGPLGALSLNHPHAPRSRFPATLIIIATSPCYVMS